MPPVIIATCDWMRMWSSFTRSVNSLCWKPERCRSQHITKQKTIFVPKHLVQRNFPHLSSSKLPTRILIIPRPTLLRLGAHAPVVMPHFMKASQLIWLCTTDNQPQPFYYPRGARSARVIAMIACLSVCLCVCVSHAGIVSKRLNVGSRQQLHVIAQRL